MTTGCTAYIGLSGGTIIIDASCTGGTIAVSGVGYLINNSALAIDVTGLAVTLAAAEENPIAANIISYGGGVDYTALGVAVWASVSRVLTAGGAPTPQDVADAVRAELAAELARLTKLAKLSGIDVPLVVTPTTRTAGDVSQTIVEVGDTVTVTTL